MQTPKRCCISKASTYTSTQVSSRIRIKVRDQSLVDVFASPLPVEQKSTVADMY